MVKSNKNIRGGGPPKIVKFKQKTYADDGLTANLRQKVYVRNPTKENKLAKLARQIDALSPEEKLKYYKGLSALRNHMENARESRSSEWALREASKLHENLQPTKPNCKISTTKKPCLTHDGSEGKCRRIARWGFRCGCRVKKRIISDYEECEERCCNSRRQSNRANINV
jgi:hypothetical protein